MSTTTYTTELPLTVRQLLDAVRWRIRAYVWLQSLAALAILIGSAFWIGLLLDWAFEPSVEVRRLVIYGVAAACLWVIYYYLLRRAFVPIDDASAAVLLERQFPQLRDHVLTAVHVASVREHGLGYHPDLMAETQRAAAAAVADVHPRQLFNRRPLARALAAALALGLSIAALAVGASETFGFWMKRMTLSPEPWPRRVSLEVVGFPADGAGNRVQKLAQEDDFELLVHANTIGHVAPDEVEIRYRLADGRRGRDSMIRVGNALSGQDEFQVYRYQFKRVTSDMMFDVVGGDDRVRDLQLRVVDRPELTSIELESVYPPYLNREARQLRVTGGMRIPEGTRLTVLAESSKPLTTATIHTSENSQDARVELSEPPPTNLRWEYGTLSGDDVLLIQVTDTDGVSCREPYRVSLSVVSDELPQVAVRLAGIGTAITPDAMIPLVGKVTDDYGIQRVWYEYQVDGGASGTRPIAQGANVESMFNQFGLFDVRAKEVVPGEQPLELTPGQKLTLNLKASDRYDLSDKPRAGSSPPFGLDVVTVAELLAQIERRELALRQRYEAIYEKMTDTRNLLGRVEFGESGEKTDSKLANETKENEGGEATEEPVDNAARTLARRRLRVAGSLQNVIQATDEVAGVAEGFDDLHDQLTNNRIDNPDLKGRLREQIALPLHQISENGLPGLSSQLKLVEEHVDEAQEGPAALAKSLVQADKLLVDMKQVLDHMLELETYNEVVALLRGIISDQDEINRRTKERQKEKLRGLFEEEKP